MYGTTAPYCSSMFGTDSVISLEPVVQSQVLTLEVEPSLGKLRKRWPFTYLLIHFVLYIYCVNYFETCRDKGLSVSPPPPLISRHEVELIWEMLFNINVSSGAVILREVQRCDWQMQVGGSTTDRIRSARLHLNDACWRSKTKDKMFSVQTLIVASLLTQLVLVVGSGGKYF